MAEGFCFTIHSGYDAAGFIMLKNIMEVSEKAEEGRNIFTALVCKRATYESIITAENQSVAVQNVYSFIIKIFC